MSNKTIGEERIGEGLIVRLRFVSGILVLEDDRNILTIRLTAKEARKLVKTLTRAYGMEDEL